MKDSSISSLLWSWQKEYKKKGTGKKSVPFLDFKLILFFIGATVPDVFNLQIICPNLFKMVKNKDRDGKTTNILVVFSVYYSAKAKIIIEYSQGAII